MKKNIFLRLLFVITLMTMMCGIGMAQTSPSGTIVTYNKNGTPNHGIKIKTNIPYGTPAMPTVMLEGYRYQQARPINVTLNWYVYQGNFIQYKASSSGAWTPTIKLANENNKVVIYIDEKGYYTRFSVRAYGKGLPGDTNSTYAGWTVVDTEPLTGTNVVTVPYENRMGILHTKDQSVSGSVNIIGGSVNLKKPNTAGGWARGLFNTDNAGTRLAGVGLYGNANTPIRYFISHGASPWSDSRGTFFLPNGNVGIGTTTPENALDVVGTIRAEECLIETGWADYVFYDDYQLPTLEEEEKHIEENGYLMGFESEQAMGGEISVGDVSVRQQVKIEEIMLHLIDLKKEVEELKRENEGLKTQMEK